MLCDKCKNKNAVYFSTLILNGVEKTSNLCEECAVKAGKMRKGKDMFDNFFKSFDKMFSSSVFDSLICPSCNTSLTNFKNHNFLGCDDCFDVFSQDIDALMNLNNDDNEIEFRTPEKSEDEKKLEKLKASLQKAIKEERYEDAGDINKQIKNLQNKMNNN